MMWHVPPDWKQVDYDTFEQIINQRGYYRDGWSGFVVYKDVPTKREFALIEELGKDEVYWVHPDLVEEK